MFELIFDICGIKHRGGYQCVFAPRMNPFDLINHSTISALTFYNSLIMYFLK